MPSAIPLEKDEIVNITSKTKLIIFFIFKSSLILLETSPASFQIIISKHDRGLFCFKISPFSKSFHLTTTPIIDVQSIDILVSIENKQFLVLIDSIFSFSQADPPPIYPSEARHTTTVNTNCMPPFALLHHALAYSVRTSKDILLYDRL